MSIVMARYRQEPKSLRQDAGKLRKCFTTMVSANNVKQESVPDDKSVRVVTPAWSPEKLIFRVDAFPHL